MSSNTAAKVLGILMTASLACSLGGPAAPTSLPAVGTSVAPPVATATSAGLGVTVSAPTATPNPAGDLTVEALSPVAVRLSWLPLEGAPQYQIDARYGEGEFFPVATVTGERTNFDHYVLAGAPELTYRVTAAGGSVVGTAPVSLPALVPDPLKVDGVPFDPVVDPIPTIDINNPVIPDTTLLIHPVGVKQTIGPEGGTIVLTSPDQAIYTLDVPPGALGQSASMVLTPIKAMPGLPLSGGLLGAVKVDPEIMFGAPLTLTIQRPPGQSAVAPLTVGFGGSDEFYLMPVTIDGPSAQLRLFRGGTFGLGVGTVEDLSEQAARLPTDNAEQLVQLLAILNASGADPEGVYNQIVAGLLAQVQQLPGPNVSASAPGRAAGLARLVHGSSNRQEAPSSPAIELWNALNAADAYFTERFSRGRIADLTGSDQASNARLVAELAARIKAFIDETNDKCLTKDDLLVAEFIRRMQLPLTIFWIFLANKYHDTYGEPSLDKNCTYELSISSQIKEELGDGSYTDTGAHTEEPINLQLIVRRGSIVLQGGGPLVYDKYTFFFSICPPPQDMQPYPSPTMWIADLSPIFDNEGFVTDFSLNRVAANAGATLTSGSITSEDDDAGNCRIVNKSQDGTLLDVWAAGFGVMHFEPYGHWDIGGSEAEVVATQEIVGRTEGKLTENSTLTLTVRKVH